MSRQDRIDYHDVAVNRARVAPYVERLLAAEALAFSFPVWNIGFPAILKGFIDKVFLPGVSFTLSENGDYTPCLHNIKQARRRLHLWRRRGCAPSSPAIPAAASSRDRCASPARRARRATISRCTT